MSSVFVILTTMERLTGCRQYEFVRMRRYIKINSSQSLIVYVCLCEVCNGVHVYSLYISNRVPTCTYVNNQDSFIVVKCNQY